MEGLLLFLFILFGSAGCIVMLFLIFIAIIPKGHGGYISSSGNSMQSSSDSAYKARKRSARDAEYIAAAQRNGGLISANDKIVIDTFYGNIDD